MRNFSTPTEGPRPLEVYILLWNSVLHVGERTLEGFSVKGGNPRLRRTIFLESQHVILRLYSWDLWPAQSHVTVCMNRKDASTGL